MQYEFTERREYVKTIEFFNTNPLVNVEKITYFKEAEVTGTFVKKEFRYSFDNSTWTNWNTLSQPNLTAIQFRDNPNFYLQVRYNRQGITTGNIKKWYLIYQSKTPTPPVPPSDASIDADTLGGEPPSYYLNVANHYGPYTSIILENVIDPSAIGTYFTRSDTSIGTTFTLRSIKGEKGISVTNQSGVIVIDGSSLQDNISSLDLSINSLYNELANVDASLDDLYTKFNSIESSIANRDSSINYLLTWNSVQDASISRIDGSLNIIFPRLDSIDSSISEIKTDLTNIEASILRIDTEQSIQDASIVDLRNNLVVSDASIIANTQTNAIQDASILKLDASQNIIYPKVISNETSIGTLTFDVSLITNSINFLTNWNTTQDGSIVNLRNTLVIVESSAGNLTVWNTIQDGSIIDLRSRIDSLDSSVIRIDGSINTIFTTLLGLDSSVIYNQQVNLTQDASIIIINSKLSVHDASIGSLTNWQISQDASIVQINTSISGLDASIQRIDSSLSDIYDKFVISDASIVNLRNRLNVVDNSISYINVWNIAQDASIVDLRNWNIAQDASITSIKNDISIIEASIAALEDNEVINVGDGSISVYSGTDTSGNILLKTIKQIGPVVITEDSSTILVDSSIVKIYDTNLDSSIENYIPVGGVRSGDTVSEYKDQTYTEILDKIMFPQFDPSFVGPSIPSFERTGNAYYEVDYNASIIFTTTFDRGLIYLNNTTQDFRSGLPETYHYLGPGIEGDVSSNSLTDVHASNIDMSIGIHTWEVYVTYNEGPQPLDSHGNNYGTPLPSQDTSIVTLTAEGVYPLFATSSVISIMAKQTLVSMLNGDDIEIELAPETGGNKQRFDIPNAWANYPTFRSLHGIETFADFSNSWEYEGGSEANSLTFWDVSTSTQSVQGNTVNYISYTYNGIDRGRIKIRLKF